MNKEELISCLDRARNGVVKVNNNEEGDFVVKKLKNLEQYILIQNYHQKLKPNIQ